MASSYFELDSGELAALGAIVPPAVAAQLSVNLGFPDRALRLLDEALKQAERRGNSLNVGYTIFFACLVNMTLTESQSLLETVEKLERVAEANPYFVGAADFCAGVALLTQGRIEEGVARTRRARAFWERIGYRILLPLVLGIEAQVCAEEDALRTIAQAMEETQDNIIMRTAVMMFRGDVLVRLGAEAREVEAAYRQAMECARVQNSRVDELQIAKRLARCLIGQGRSAEARAILVEIYGSFTEGFDTAALREAKALLQELDAKPQPPSSPPDTD